MFIVLLKISRAKAEAGRLMSGHNAWIGRGFDDGVFVLVGGLKPGLGGAIVAHGTSRADLEDRVREDPFVAQGVVEPEILEVGPARVDPRLEFLR